jgi:hypothetical protein
MKKLLMFSMWLFSSLAHSAAQTIDFDALLPGTLVTDQFASQGVLISSSFGDVRVFSGCCSDSGTNSLDGGQFREVVITFVDPADALRPATTDFFSMTLGDVDIPGNGMTAYDVLGRQIARVVSSCAADFACPGDSLYETLSLSVAGMHRIVIAAGGQLSNAEPRSEATVDSFVFNQVVAQVPEPLHAQMLAAGLTLLLAVAVRRSRLSRVSQRSRGRGMSAATLASPRG